LYPDTFLSPLARGLPLRPLVLHLDIHFTNIRCLLHGFNPLYVGLYFLPGGIGVIIGRFIASYLLDYNYKALVSKEGIVLNRESSNNIAIFPIEYARSR